MKRWILCMTLVAMLLLGGCGGGSVGTGYDPGGGSQHFEGVITSNGKPLPNASITVLSTGETVQSDSQGAFSVALPENAENRDLLVTTSVSSTRVTLPDSTQSVVNVEVDVSKPAKPVTITTLSMSAKIVGACDIFFENNRTIRQANPVPQGASCTTRVEIEGDGKPLGGVRFAVEYKGCRAKDPWRLVAASETSEKFYPGIGQLQFTYRDSATYCEYRIIAPYQTKGIAPIEYRILTFTKQAQ